MMQGAKKLRKLLGENYRTLKIRGEARQIFDRPVPGT